jgi:hypothetical protein
VKYVRILLHSFLSLAPVLGIRWLLLYAADRIDPAIFAYGPGCSSLFLVILPVTSFIPLILASVARNRRRAPGDPALTPLHPVGWVTVAGMWGHIPAFWIASNLSGDLHEVSFSVLGPPLIVLSVVLSWRYVEKRAKALPKPPAPAPDDF